MTHKQTLVVDPSNADQARAWDGDEGEYWAAHADQFDRSLARYHQRFLDAASITDGAVVLDVGCGTGQTTRDAARRVGSGTALGVDLSGQMLDVARGRAEHEGVGNASFEQADAQVHPFPDASFDITVSRTAAMFFGDPVAAFSNLARALRPGGRLVLLVWQDLARNEWLREISTALAAGRNLPAPAVGAPGPFALSDPERLRHLLASAGFGEPGLDDLREQMFFGTDTEDAFAFILGVSGWMLEGLDQEGRARALAALRATLTAHQTDEGVAFGSATWLVTAKKL